MGGLFGVASKTDCIMDLFYGVDYHSHLGTRRGGMATHGADGFCRSIHNIENSPFRTKFERDVEELTGNLGIGCISDYEPQPLLIQSHLGSFAITTVGKINNADELLNKIYENGHSHFQEMSGGQINATELVAALICKQDSFENGIRYAQEAIDGSLTLLIMTKDGIYAARDIYGRTPLVIGHREGAYCAAFENFSYINLGYTDVKELGPGEIVYITPESVETLVPPRKKMKICSFLWVYYGYPTSSYEGVNVEEMRYNCGALLAKRDKGKVDPDIVAGVPDSGIAHAIGYANESGVPFARPFIKYTPTWPRSFMPTDQRQRELIARMKLIPVHALIKNKKLLLIDDSIVRGTTCKQIIQMAREAGAKNVYFCSAAPAVRYPNVYGIDMPSAHELIAHNRSTEDVSKLIGADWLVYQDLPDLIDAVGGGKIKIDHFDCAVFDGEYVTGDVNEAYLNRIEQARNDATKAKSQAVSAIIDLYND